MKNFLLLLFCFLFIPIYSQVDKKYLAGAVPEVNGKVVFSETFDLNGIAKAQIYERALQWANTNFNTDDNRVVYSDRENAVLSCKGLAELVFSSGALSLDRTFMNFQLNIFCEDNSCRVEIKSISYSYSVSYKKEPEKYHAEEWITDEKAVNKDKLYRGNGKFRIKTIDFKEDLYNSLYTTLRSGNMNYLYDEEKNKESVSYKKIPQTTQAIVEQTLENKPVVSEEVKFPGTPPSTKPFSAATLSSSTDLSLYRKIDADKLPGNIIKMLTNDWMLVTAGDDSKFNMMTASWGGIGVLWGKPVTFCFINPARYTFQFMEKGDNYTLSFYTEVYRDALQYCGSVSGKDVDKIAGSGLTPITLPSGAKAFGEAWLIIECKKILGQQISKDAVFDENAKENWSADGKQFHKIFAGEILNIWVK